MKEFLFFFSFSVLFISCVGKKKHLETVQTLKRTHQDSLTTVTNRLKRQLRLSQDSVYSLELQLAERKGENNILSNLRQELLTEIERLESQVENLSVSSQSNQTDLNNILSNKENQIKSLKIQLQHIEAVLDGRQEAFKQLSSDLHFAFQEISFNDFELITNSQGLEITFPKSIFFRKGSTSRVEKKGHSVMEATSKVFSRYPVMQIAVTGHTDNSPTGRKSITNNWVLSALQAATIVNILGEDYDVNTSQMTASGKGEYEPKTSNATPQGKTLNKRIEWVISQRNVELEREIRKILTKTK